MTTKIGSSGLNFTEPPPDLIDGEEHHKVEAILQHKGTGSRHWYLVSWVGYPPSERMWLLETELKSPTNGLALMGQEGLPSALFEEGNVPIGKRSSVTPTFRGVDALTSDITRVDLARDMSLNTISTRYNQGKIKQALLNLLELRNFHATVMAVKEERAFDPPPDPVEVVERAIYDRALTPCLPQPHSETPEPIPNVTQLTNPKIDHLYEEYEREHYTPRNPTPNFDTISITIPKLDECTPEPPTVNPDDWVPTDVVPHLSISSPHTLPTPRHRNRHPRATSVLSLGLPLSHAHRPRIQNYTRHFTREEA
ncbi:uncharacterized protein HD556DRAFT_1448653 [Suillus plorans]|uniref:Chromo domain-containing protein n=1 Tax=Suillus plorans TaxID=116603 RepID=A0A9P7AE21_9AGAM|nr:uncharacterized protein HD556DRAFT_1448653 [Suillus plorans]KAG1787466.1 hypothetical protein HD556DRAFT_1448653 [Suillus plorans]